MKRVCAVLCLLLLLLDFFSSKVNAKSASGKSHSIPGKSGHSIGGGKNLLGQAVKLVSGKSKSSHSNTGGKGHGLGAAAVAAGSKLLTHNKPSHSGIGGKSHHSAGAGLLQGAAAAAHGNNHLGSNGKHHIPGSAAGLIPGVVGGGAAGKLVSGVIKHGSHDSKTHSGGSHLLPIAGGSASHHSVIHHHYTKRKGASVTIYSGLSLCLTCTFIIFISTYISSF